MTSDQREKKTQDRVDQTSSDSFPASDPPSHSGITGPGKPPTGPQRGDEDRPTGTPTSNRHANETSHQSEDELLPPQSSNQDKPPARGHHKANPARGR